MNYNDEPSNEPGADENLISEDLNGEPAAPLDEPDYKSLYEEAKSSQATQSGKLQAELSQARAVNDARMSHLESLITQVAVGRQQPAPQAEPIDPDDPAAMLKYADRLVNQRLSENNAAHEQRYNQLAGQAVEAEIRSVQAENEMVVNEYNHEIEAYFARTPSERYRPGAYRELVTYLKGQHFEELAGKYKANPQRTFGIPSPTGLAPTGTPPKPPGPPKRELSDEQARLARIYGQLEGVETITADEWFSVNEDRKQYPGRRPRGR